MGSNIIKNWKLAKRSPFKNGMLSLTMAQTSFFPESCFLCDKAKGKSLWNNRLEFTVKWEAAVNHPFPFSLTSLSKHNFAKETRRLSRESTTEQEAFQFSDKGEEHRGKRVGKSIQLFPHWALWVVCFQIWSPSGYNPLLSKGISIQKWWVRGGATSWDTAKYEN